MSRALYYKERLAPVGHATGDILEQPRVLDAIQRDSDQIGFTMASEPLTGSLLRVLAASKPGGRLLELGTGTGVGTAWLLAGMDAGSRLDTVESDPHALDVARRHLGGDPRVTFHPIDGAAFLRRSQPGRYDLVFADTWPGKFTHLDLALGQLRTGGIFLVDDLLPQPNWPDGHGAKVSALIEELERREGFLAVKLSWGSGLMILVREGLIRVRLCREASASVVLSRQRKPVLAVVANLALLHPFEVLPRLVGSAPDQGPKADVGTRLR